MPGTRTACRRGHHRLGELGGPGQDTACLVPLVEITATGHGRLWSGERFIETAIGERLVYRDHETVASAGGGERRRSG
ncbi:hypothetical protein [Streptomyces griseorubiginosus]